MQSKTTPNATMFINIPEKRDIMFWMVPVQSILDLRQWDASARADVKYFPHHHITHLEFKLAGIHQVTLIQNICLCVRICTYIQCRSWRAPLIKFKECLLTLLFARRCSQSCVLSELNSTREKSWPRIPKFPPAPSSAAANTWRSRDNELLYICSSRDNGFPLRLRTDLLPSAGASWYCTSECHYVTGFGFV